MNRIQNTWAVLAVSLCDVRMYVGCPFGFYCQLLKTVARSRESACFRKVLLMWSRSCLRWREP